MPDSIISLRDGDGDEVRVRARQFDDGSVAFYHAQDTRLPSVVNRGGSITVSNQSQLLAEANSARVMLTVQNTSAGILYLAEDGQPATQASFKLYAGQTAEITSNAAVYILGSAGATFAASEAFKIYDNATDEDIRDGVAEIEKIQQYGLGFDTLADLTNSDAREGTQSYVRDSDVDSHPAPNNGEARLDGGTAVQGELIPNAGNYKKLENGTWFRTGNVPAQDAPAAIQPALDEATTLVAAIPSQIQPLLSAANSSATSASQSAANSKTNADRASLAATQAAVAQPAYDTVAAGLAATPNGGVFNVRGTGDTFATSYRNDNGVASAALSSFPSKAYMDGIAPAVNSKVLVLRKATGVDVDNPTKDNGVAIRAAFDEASLMGKTLDLGNDLFRVGSGWSTYALTAPLNLRGDGATIRNISTGNKTFMALRAPVSLDGINFNTFSSILTADTNGINMSDYDIILRNINHLNAVQALIIGTLESFRIRDLIMENINIIGQMTAAGTGRGQGIRYQMNGFRRAYLRNIFVQNTSYQGIRVGGYPHDLVLNKHIHMETLHVDTCIGESQCNGIQAFGSDVYLDDLYVRKVDCIDGSSSNVEPLYTVGDRVYLGNITIEDAGNQQGAIAIKSSKTKQHGPITYRTRLHPRMYAGIRIDGTDVELTKGITFHWVWEPISPCTAGSGTDAYNVDYHRLDTELTDTVTYYFVPHAVNTTSSPTLKIGNFAAKPMVTTAGNPIYPRQLRPDVVYKAMYSPSADRFAVRAAIWSELVPIVDGNDNNITLPTGTTLVDGKTYWAIPMRTMGANATITVGNQVLPIMVQGESGITPHPAGGPVSNGFIKGYWYSAADQAMVVIGSSGTPYEGTGRFVPELRGTGDAFTFNHPYKNDYSDALFVMPIRNNVGPATLNGDPLLTSSGAALTEGYIRASYLYQLIRDEATSSWRATRIGGSANGIDTASGAEGRQVFKDITFINAQYSTGISSYSGGFAEVSGIKQLGQSRLGRTVAFSTTSEAPIQAKAYVSDIKISHYGMDFASTSVISASGRFSSLDVSNIPPPAIRGTVTNGGAIIAGVTTVGDIEHLRVRNVHKGSSGYSLITQVQGFAAIDSDHITEFPNLNPPAVPGGGFVEFSNNYTHYGAEPGDLISVSHEMNNTRLQFGGYATARDVVRVFARDPNPSGASIDIEPGKLFITSRRIRPAQF